MPDVNNCEGSSLIRLETAINIFAIIYFFMLSYLLGTYIMYRESGLIPKTKHAQKEFMLVHKMQYKT